MAINRPKSIEYVPTINSSAKTNEFSLEDIDPELIREVEEMYVNMKSAPNGRFRMAFDTRADLLQYQAMATAYCALRVDADGNPAPIRFRKSPSKDLAKDGPVGDFKVTDLPADGTAEIREATDAVKATTVSGVPVPTKR